MGRLTTHLQQPLPDAFAAFGQNSSMLPAGGLGHPEWISVGSDTEIMEYATLVALHRPASHGQIVIGNGVRLARFNTIVSASEVRLGDHVGTADGVTIVDTWDHPGGLSSYASVALGGEGPVVIESGAYLGPYSTIGPGVRVGRGAFVGAGAVVVEDVLAHTAVWGNPARVAQQACPQEGSTCAELSATRRDRRGPGLETDSSTSAAHAESRPTWRES
jgi:acetyltransferase-like isoleucine patch superfamily enzyme